jgi:two-component system, cell cycle response regulator
MSETQRVLVVEDDPDINAIVGAYVELEGFEYVPAFHGQQALDEARTGQLSLVLLDLMLPDMDGFAICRALKEDPRTAHLPVVMLTALDDGESRRKGLEAGASAYLTKPFHPDRLLQAIRANVLPGAAQA